MIGEPTDDVRVPIDEQRDLNASREWLNARPLTRALAITCEVIEPGRAVFSFDPPEDWRNPNASLPGAMLAALADHSAGFAAVSVTGRDAYVATVDLNLRFLRPAFAAPIRSETRVVRRGRRLVFLQTELNDAEGTLVADGTASFFLETGLGKAHPIGGDD
jgi:uncharacterized protein (TIGR00369 family)